MYPKKIVAIGGKRCVGKTWLANISLQFCKDNNISASKIAIADALKREFCESKGLSFDRMINDYEYKATHRKSLLKYAHEVEKKYGDKYWITHLLKFSLSNVNEDVIIIHDVRLKFELRAIQEFCTKHNIALLTVYKKLPILKRQQYGWIYDKHIDDSRFETDLENTDDLWIEVDEEI